MRANKTPRRAQPIPTMPFLPTLSKHRIGVTTFAFFFKLYFFDQINAQEWSVHQLINIRIVFSKFSFLFFTDFRRFSKVRNSLDSGAGPTSRRLPERQHRWRRSLLCRTATTHVDGRASARGSSH